MSTSNTPAPRLIAWEITRRCNLFCAHCRADAEECEYDGELSTDQCLDLLDQMAGLGNPIVILTGGEPLLRPDVFELAAYGVKRGLRVVMAPNGTLVTPEVARQMADVGIRRISVSIDFPDATLHDQFRGVAGAYAGAMQGIGHAMAAGVEIQINSTITKLNIAYLDDLLQLALDLGASAFHPFLLVPTGRGKGLEDQELSPEDYERTLNWIYDRQQELGDRIFFKPTDAPHYMRVLRQRGGSSHLHPHQQSAGHAPASHGCYNSLSRGCLAGLGFMFISHIGDVQGCGYLTVKAGNVLDQPLVEIWNESQLFRDLRDLDRLSGKCGACEFKRICGGCRARAYEATGDYLAEEPYCTYQPHGWQAAQRPANHITEQSR